MGTRRVEFRREPRVRRPTKFENTAGRKFTCSEQSESSTLHFVSGENKAVGSVTYAFGGCKLEGVGCKSSGAAAEEIVSATLKGELGWDEKAGEKVGLRLQPVEGPEHAVIEATCGSTPVKVRGAVIAPITAINSMAKSFKLKYKEKKGEQDPESFEGKSASVLEMSFNGGVTYTQAGMNVESTLKTLESIEINTTV